MSVTHTGIWWQGMGWAGKWHKGRGREAGRVWGNGGRRWEKGCAVHREVAEKRRRSQRSGAKSPVPVPVLPAAAAAEGGEGEL